MSRPAPYIGVSGVISPAQADHVADLAAAAGLPGVGRRLLLGVKATHKTQMLDTQNKYGPDWYPVGPDGFAGALDAATRAVRTERVAQLYLEAGLVGDVDYRQVFMDRVVTRGRSWLTGLQFDMLPWDVDPDMGEFLRLVKERYKLPIWLQCHGPAMTEYGPSGAASALSDLAGVVDYVLFDSSHGTGHALDARVLGEFLEAAYTHQRLTQVGFAVAGGLDAQSVSGLRGLVAQFPDLSWDAEARMHPKTGTGGRPLDLDTAGKYLRASVEVLNR